MCRGTKSEKRDQHLCNQTTSRCVHANMRSKDWQCTLNDKHSAREEHGIENEGEGKSVSACESLLSFSQ